MTRNDSASQFIQLLTEAYQADCMVRTTQRAAQSSADATKFKQHQMAALHQYQAAMEPLDCFRLMILEPDER